MLLKAPEVSGAFSFSGMAVPFFSLILYNEMNFMSGSLPYTRSWFHEEM